MPTQSQNHPFAEYIRILGKGKRGSRPLTREEAYSAMQMILTGQVEAVQLGAFLMLMRVKEETPGELAGFVQAAQDSFAFLPDAVRVDLDWSSYAGKRRHLPWFLLSALLLAENGARILMHGARGHSPTRLYTEDALHSLGIAPTSNIEEAAGQIREHNFSYLPLQRFCPRLQEIIELRPLLGLRSPVHTLVRMLNPCHAPYSFQGIFHPGYQPVHQQAALLLKQPHMAVLKGEGGETERNPDMTCLVQSVHDGEATEEQWPALFRRRHIKPDSLDPKLLAAVWRGKHDDEFGQAAVLGTTAIALKLLGKADTQRQAQSLAEDFWRKRRREIQGCR